MRVGTGFDIHRLVSGRKLILGGVEIPFDKGLEGHSDGDSLTHAIIDALLGAAALGDIGVWFPPGDPNYKDADSMDMLRRVKALLDENEFDIANIDATVICEQPKLSPHFETMRDRISTILALPSELVSVKATTMERLGPIGEGLAIAAQAVVLIQ
jgi:2-C-methyl-D-erythritol 2,4-cyclodiphosphate synthase